MTNGSVSNLSKTYDLSALGAELASIAKALSRVSAKLQNASITQAHVTKKTDPDMFTKEFLQSIEQSKKDIAKKQYKVFKTSKDIDVYFSSL